MPRSVQYVYRSQNLLKLNMQCQRTIPKENTKNKPPSLTFSKIPRTWSFHVVVLQRTAKKCTKNYNARAQLLFCSLNFLFCGVLVAVAVVVCLRSLLADFYHHVCMYSIVEGESRGTGIWDCRGRMKKKEKEGSSKFPSKRTDKFKNIV